MPHEANCQFQIEKISRLETIVSQIFLERQTISKVYKLI